MNKTITMLTLLCIAAFAQQKGAFNDPRDKKAYKTTKIGVQIWLAENLSYNAKGSKCHNDSPANCTKYGRIYDWETAMKACPEGWHLPTEAEWNTLLKTAGGESKLKAKKGWKELPNDKNAAMGNVEAYADISQAGNGTDDYGFTALPICDNCRDGYWWSASKNTAYDDDEGFMTVIFMGLIPDGPDYGQKSDLYSVRCLQN